MDFELSEEQQLLKDMAGRFMQDRYGFETRGKYMKEPLGFDPAIWEAYAEQGLLALPRRSSAAPASWPSPTPKARPAMTSPMWRPGPRRPATPTR